MIVAQTYLITAADGRQCAAGKTEADAATVGASHLGVAPETVAVSPYEHPHGLHPSQDIRTGIVYAGHPR